MRRPFDNRVFHRCPEGWRINIHFTGAGDEELSNRWSGSLDYEPYISFDTLASIADVHIQSWDVEWCQKASPRELAFRALEALSAGRYLEMNINEFFLLGGKSGLQQDIRHHTLIYGFDQADLCFQCATYLRDGSYGTGRIPAGLLSSAVLSFVGTHLPAHLAYSAGVVVREIAVGSAPATTLDSEIIVSQLICFEASRCCDGLWLRGSVPGTTYGRDVYSLIATYLEGCHRRRSPINPNVTRFFWERQKLMGKRFSALEEQVPALNVQRISEQWLEIERAFQKIHLMSVLPVSPRTPNPRELFSHACKREAEVAAASVEALRSYLAQRSRLR